MENRKSDRWPLAAFVVAVLLIGLNPIGVRYTVLELPPFWGATLRFAPASVLLFLLALILKLQFLAGAPYWGQYYLGL